MLKTFLHQSSNGKNNTSKGVHVHFVIGTLIFATIFLIGAIWKSAMTFQPIDPFSQIHPLTPQKIVTFGGAPEVVNVFLTIDTFQKVDFQQGEFIFYGMVGFEFNPDLVPLSVIEAFDFEKASILEKSKPTIIKKGQNIFATYNVVVRFTPDLDYSFFPLDDHQVPLVMVNRSVTPSRVIFETSEVNFKINHNLERSGWIRILKTTATGYLEQITDHGQQKRPYPAALFLIGYGRAGIKHLINLLAPLVLLFALSLFSLCFDPVQGLETSLAVSLASIGALIGFRFVIDSVAPVVAYFLMSDYLFLIALGCVFAIFACNVAARIMPRWFLYLFVVIINAVLVYGYHYYLLVWLS